MIVPSVGLIAELQVLPLKQLNLLVMDCFRQVLYYRLACRAVSASGELLVIWYHFKWNFDNLYSQAGVSSERETDKLINRD